MPRQIEFAGTPEECALLIERLQDQPGIVRLSLQPGASVMPKGDILTVEAANQASTEIVNIPSDLGLLHTGAMSITEPTPPSAPTRPAPSTKKATTRSGRRSAR